MLCVVRDKGIWQNSSVQSIMQWVEGHVSLNAVGIVFITEEFDDQIDIEPSIKYIKFIQVIIYRDVVDFDNPKSQDMCRRLKPLLIHDITSSS